MCSPRSSEGGVVDVDLPMNPLLGRMMAAFPKYFPYLVIAGLFGSPDPYDLGANALERVA